MARGERLRLGLFGDDRAAERDALVADTNGAGASDEALNLILTPATK